MPSGNVIAVMLIAAALILWAIVEIAVGKAYGKTPWSWSVYSYRVGRKEDPLSFWVIAGGKILLGLVVLVVQVVRS